VAGVERSASPEPDTWGLATRSSRLDPGPPAMDRSRHGYKRVSIVCGDGTALTFVAGFSAEFKNVKVQALHKTIAKYRAGAW